MELSSTTPPRFDRRMEELLRRFTLPGLILPHCTLQGPLRHLRKAAQLLEVLVAVICLQFVIGPHTARRRGAMRAVPFLGAWLPAFLLLLAAVPPGAQCQTSTTTTITTPPPPCGGGGLLCGGTCPPGAACSRVCGVFLCHCACTYTCSRSQAPTCGGTCPSGQVCGQASGQNSCTCVGSDDTCAISQAPTCGGTCPELSCCPNGQVCAQTSGGNSCACVCNAQTLPCPFVTKWGSQGGGDGQFANPTGVAVDGSGNVFVADSGNDRIQKFTNTGTFLTKWGSYGSGN